MQIIENILREQTTQQERTSADCIKNTGNIVKLFATKVDKPDYEKCTQQLSEQLETIKFATYDNFRTILATDNYIEKYLPFQTQALISAGIESLFPKEKKDLEKKKKWFEKDSTQSE